MKYIRKFIFLFTLIALLCSQPVYASITPEIVGEAGITIDATTGEMIYTKNIDTRLFPASITKLMTAIILAENNEPEDIFTYTQNAKNQEPFTFSFNIEDIDAMDKMTASEAMDAMLLPSANDIAYMIGENVGKGNYSVFIQLMNKKAQSLKLKNTHFVTANGLHDLDHYSSAYDLSVIAREASKYPWIMNSLSKKQSQIKSENGVVATFLNKNKLLSEPGCIGGKTGYTSKAGRCLVSYFEINGRKLVGVVLKSDYDKEDKTVFEDMKRIINWSYNTKRIKLIKGNSDLKNVSVKYSLLPYNLGPIKAVDIPLHTKSDMQRYVSSDIYETTYSVFLINPFKLNKDVAVGSVTITSRETKEIYPLYPSISTREILNSNRGFYIILFIILSILILTLIVFTKYKINIKENLK